MGMIEEKTWEEFTDAKLFWWVNRSLHLLGWALVKDVAEDGTVLRVFPARCKFRGFNREIEEDGFIGLTKHIAETMPELVVEASE